MVDEKQQAETYKVKTETIINLNKAVSGNEMSKNSAVALLVNMGFEEETANEIISDERQINTGANQSIES